MINATKQAWNYAEKISLECGVTSFVIMKQCEKQAKLNSIKYGGSGKNNKVTTMHVKNWIKFNEKSGFSCN